MQPILYVHSELDLQRDGPSSAFGLSAGFLSTRRLGRNEHELWTALFEHHWKDACRRLGDRLVEERVDCFALVPCSRRAVIEGLREGLTGHGLREWSQLFEKDGSEISYRAQGAEYIAQNTNLGSTAPVGVRKVAICDDYAGTGATLRGLYDLARSNLLSSHIEFILAAVGVSATLDTGMVQRARQ